MSLGPTFFQKDCQYLDDCYLILKAISLQYLIGYNYLLAFATLFLFLKLEYLDLTQLLLDNHDHLWFYHPLVGYLENH